MAPPTRQVNADIPGPILEYEVQYCLIRSNNLSVGPILVSRSQWLTVTLMVKQLSLQIMCLNKRLCYLCGYSNMKMDIPTSQDVHFYCRDELR